MIATCPEGQEVESCVDPYRPIIDPIFDVPVTSSRTNITYKNVHCAICNKDFDVKVDTRWDIEFGCNIPDLRDVDMISFVDNHELQETFLECLEFDDIMQNWKLNSSCTYYKLQILRGHEPHVEDLNFGYQKCFLLFHRPSSIRNILRPCSYKMIGTCPSQMDNVFILRRCESYQDVISKNRCAFRNPYCAFCWDTICPPTALIPKSYNLLLKWNNKCDGVQENKFQGSCEKLSRYSNGKFSL